MHTHASSTSPENISISTLFAQLAPVAANFSAVTPHDGTALRHNAGLLKRIAESCLGHEGAEIGEMAGAVRGFLGVAVGSHAESMFREAKAVYFALRILAEDAMRKAGYAEMANSFYARA